MGARILPAREWKRTRLWRPYGPVGFSTFGGMQDDAEARETMVKHNLGKKSSESTRGKHSKTYF